MAATKVYDPNINSYFITANTDVEDQTVRESEPRYYERLSQASSQDVPLRTITQQTYTNTYCDPVSTEIVFEYNIDTSSAAVGLIGFTDAVDPKL